MAPDGTHLGIPASFPDSIDPSRFQGAAAVVVLPTLNEKEGLARTLSKLPLDQFAEADQKIQPLVIDGGSTDGTLDVAREWGIPVVRQTGRGKGGAMIEAVSWVHQMGIPFVVVLDADATYPPDRILPALHLLRGGTDLVIGVRRPVWGPPSDLKDLVHRTGNIIFSYTASLLTRRPILDLCSGFWGVSTARFMELELDNSGFAIEAELVLKSVRRGLSIHQIPVDYFERVGQAKLRALRDGGHILASILRNARREVGTAQHRRESAPWGRDLLSIGLTLGLSGALLDCAPSGAPEARQIAHYLRRSLPQTRVRVGNQDPVTLGSEGASTPIGWVEDTGPEASVPRLQVSLPPTASEAGKSRSATVSIRSNRGQMTIELPADMTKNRPPGPSSVWARAGGWRTSELNTESSSPSLMILTSRLNSQRNYQQATLLSANGFHVTEQLQNPIEASRVPRIEGVSSVT
jgi:dolichol-phosphate mannosyltransferase